MPSNFYTIFRLGLFLLICSNFPTLLAGQGSANPFDLEHRLSKKVIRDSSANDTETSNPFDLSSREKEEDTEVENTEEESATDIPSESKSENPFDIQRIQTETGKKASVPTKVLPKKENSPASTVGSVDKRSGFLFWSILTMMIILALLFTLYRSLIGKIYRAFINENILKLLQREQSLFISIPYLFLYVLFFLSAGIFIFQTAYHFGYVPYQFSVLNYCILGVGIFFILKHFILKILEWIFPIDKEVKQYSFTIIIFSIILGMILIPFNVFIAFAPDTMTSAGIISALIGIVAVYLFRALRGIFIGSKFLAFHKFHFFMYICIVEIVPSVILVKLLLNGANIQ